MHHDLDAFQSHFSSHCQSSDFHESHTAPQFALEHEPQTQLSLADQAGSGILGYVGSYTFSEDDSTDSPRCPPSTLPSQSRS